MNLFHRICLGTAQFGLDYGVSNKHGKINACDVGNILKRSQKHGVHWLDTAADYGTCEEALAAHKDELRKFKIATKSLKYDPIEARPFQEIENLYRSALLQSCKKLHREHADIYYLRSPEEMLNIYGERVIEFIARLKDDGIIKKIGISVYDQNQIEKILQHFTPDIIQVPCNVLDQRLIKSGTLKDLKKMGIEIFARSAFMQGLILMQPSKTPKYFEPIRQHLKLFHHECRSHGITPIQAALSFILSQEHIDRIILGVSSLDEWEEILNIISKPMNTDLDWTSIRLDNEDYLNPAKWNIAQ